MVLRNLPRFLQATNSDEACGEDARGVSKTRLRVKDFFDQRMASSNVPFR